MTPPNLASLAAYLKTPEGRNALRIERDRKRCVRLAEFAKAAWHILEPGTPLAWNWVLDSICEHLEAVSRGEILRLLVNVPPGCMKSLLTSVIWPAWEWTTRPERRFLGTSHAQDLAIRDSTKMRRLIESDWYQARWPLKLRADQNAKTSFDTEASGFRKAMAFTSMTGARGDAVILDDPHSVSSANSATQLAGTIECFRETLPTRINNDRSAIVIIMQRLAVGDVSDVALEFGYQHVCYPMRYEAGRSKWVVGSGDPRTVEGELLFPERYSERMVSELERILGSHAAAGQLQQRPSARGGGVWKTAWFGTYAVEPMHMRQRVIVADTAMKTDTQHDYSVFQLWGLSASDGKAYLLDQMRGKWEAPELLRNAQAFYAKHRVACQDKGPLLGFHVEDKASGVGLIQQMRRTGIPVKPIKRSAGRDKYSRFMSAAPYLEAGMVMLPADAPWLADYLSECEALTANDTHPHDDQADPTCDAIELLLGGGGGAASVWARLGAQSAG